MSQFPSFSRLFVQTEEFARGELGMPAWLELCMDDVFMERVKALHDLVCHSSLDLSGVEVLLPGLQLGVGGGWSCEYGTGTVSETCLEITANLIVERCRNGCSADPNQDDHKRIRSTYRAKATAVLSINQLLDTYASWSQHLEHVHDEILLSDSLAWRFHVTFGDDLTAREAKRWMYVDTLRRLRGLIAEDLAGRGHPPLRLYISSDRLPQE